MDKVFNLKITEHKQLNHNTILIECEPADNQSKIPRFEVSSFAYIYTDDKNYKRPYTPIYCDEKKVIFAVKIYEKGLLTQFLNKKRKNDEIICSYPLFKTPFNTKHKDVLMIAGGTGITPMLQILDYVYTNRKNQNIVCKFTLFFCNLTLDDMFLIDMIENFKDFTKIVHVIEKLNPQDYLKCVNEFENNSEKKTSQWINNKHENCSDSKDIESTNIESRKSQQKLNNHLNITNGEFFYKDSRVISGRINEEIIRSEAEVEGTLLFDYVYVCGPPAMVANVCGPKTLTKEQGPLFGMLKNIGFTSDNVYKF
ncbi:hypothetical protein EDEG_02425 [Edhazardia aedis USNM 41457]|uniref:cytochrome-b5 reductase n=1 Tax=Edhazardia aedis (strain USNM 41457) TaxID=1003232 RepID=J9DKU1_EDHAE|nr:hypothetical protein EDEG_02425 [Edhazardia aedis USNM 41457]|eukprot:EJW03210.1 hypothetical protein EDEG_02425 [Edhazardia aedis USNM 41457]